MKKLTTIILAVLLLISAASVNPVFVLAESGEPELKIAGDYAYKINDDNTAEIFEYLGIDEEIIIPNELDGCIVTSIGEYAFSYNNAIKKVVVSDSITNIGFCAFEFCESLEEVILSENLLRIEDDAFSACFSLDKITMPSSLQTVGSNVFSGTKLWNDALNTDDDLFYIDDVLFGYGVGRSKKNVSVNIKEGTRLIADCAFIRDKGIYDVTFPSTLRYIGEGAFEECIGITDINIPDAVEIGSCAFWGCSNITDISLADTIETIGAGAFYNCVSLTEITLPESFSGSIDQLFAGCENLENIWISTNNENFSSVDGILYSKDLSTLVLFPCGREYDTKLILDSVTIFGEYSFAGNTKIKKFVFPETVEKAGTGMAMNSQIETIVFSENIQIIDEGVTYGCENLVSATILNPECEIYYEDYTINNTATIYGYNNSTAQEYADYYERNYISLEDDLENKHELGDTDNDGKITVKDATLIQKAIASIITLDDATTKCADVNADSKVNIKDATAIQKFVAHIITSFNSNF